MYSALTSIFGLALGAGGSNATIGRASGADDIAAASTAVRTRLRPAPLRRSVVPRSRDRRSLYLRSGPPRGPELFHCGGMWFSWRVLLQRPYPPDRGRPIASLGGGGHMATERIAPDLEDGDELTPVVKETSRGGNEPPADINDRPEQNIGYDEAVKGAPLTAEERDRAKRESPLSD